jgi:hypothetical protein
MQGDDRAAQPRIRLDAGGTRPRLRALHVMGHGSARIARALGTSEDTIQRLVRGDAPPSAPSCATRSPTCMTPGGTSAPPNAPGPNAPPPAPAAAGNRCAAAALNDNQLDTPGYRPRAGYRPATGTGIAPDIRLPVRQHYKRKGAKPTG